MAIASCTLGNIGGYSGGYDYKFVNTPPDRLICKICHLPSRQAFLTTCCGHIFCKSCLDNAKRNTAVNCCPVCRDEEFISYTNKQADREIRGLHVMCINVERGCEWQGALSDIDNHLGNSDGCQFEDVNCINDCGMMLQRRHMASHVKTECTCRKINCQYCDIIGEHQFIDGEHKKRCPKFPLSCPNKCEVGIILREDMETHKNECPFEEVECFVKCGKILRRQDLTSHIENECPCRKVNCQYCHSTGEHQIIEGEHKEQCPKLPLPCPNKCEVESIPFEDMEAHKKECPLEIVQCEYHNVGCGERMMRKDLKKHGSEKMKEHLSLTKSSLASTTQRLNETQQELSLTYQELSSELADTKSQLNSALEQINSLMILVHQAAIPHGHTSGNLASIASRTKWWAKLAAMAAINRSGDQVLYLGKAGRLVFLPMWHSCIESRRYNDDC
ncbi:TNF receptor-associated factor 4-like [Dysidea avara]|uniref:TNF receptor-associated factor 4-like n=1 Tax=Dysidea avara TaxID=196820 RepID=UPI00331CE7A4